MPPGLLFDVRKNRREAAVPPELANEGAMPQGIRTTLVYLGLSAAAKAVMADDGAIERCRRIAEPIARLACYDAIGSPAAVPRPGASTSSAGQAKASSGEQPGDAGAGSATEAEFGLEWMAASRKAMPDSLSSFIPGAFEGWVPRERFALANGQVWEITDGSQAAYSLRDPKVRITRGLSGSFFMHIEGVSQTPRVRRLR